MENNLPIPDKIDLYLKGGLPESEKKAFEIALESDSELREELELRRMMVQTGQFHARRKLKKQLQPIQQEYFIRQDLKKTVVRRLVRRGIAAAVIMFFLGAGAGYWFRLSFETSKPEPATTTPAPPIAIDQNAAQQEEKEDIQVGTPPSQSLFKGKIPLRILTIQNGKREKSAASAPVQLEVVEDDAAGRIYVFNEQQLKIFTSNEDDFFTQAMQVVELRLDNLEARFYLRIGDTWHPILPGGKPGKLVVENEDALLRILRENDFQ